MTRVKKNISIDSEVWEKSGEVLAGIGMTRSKFIEITLRGLMRSQMTVYSDVCNGLFGDLVQNSKIKKKKPK